MNRFLDPNTIEDIGLDYALGKLNIITPYGKNLKDNMMPFNNGEENSLTEEFDRVDKFVNLINKNKFLLKNIKNILNHIKDIRNSVSRAVEGYILNNVELFEIKGFILTLSELKEELNSITNELDDSMKIKRIIELENLLDPQNTKIKSFYIYDEYSDELKFIRERKRQLNKRIKLERKNLKEKLETELFIKVNLDNSVVVSKNDKETFLKLSDNPYLNYNSETYMDVKFSLKSPSSIYELERQLVAIKESEEEEEQNIRQYLSEKIGCQYTSITKNTQAIGKLDLTIGKANMAIDTNSVKPIILPNHTVTIVEGRHLKVEDSLKSNNKLFTPISIKLKEGIACITGANMGGKTVSLKLVGLLCAMAQYGLFVPCTSMETGLHGFIYGSIGDMQSTDNGLSTFGSEINNIKKALKRADEMGIILIDELARGTNPDEGYAISKAIVNFLKDKQSITLITTHYDDIATSDDIVHYQVIGLSGIDYEELKERMTNIENHMKTENRIKLLGQYMDYRLAKVTKDTKVPRDAINIARLMGLDQSITEDAERILNIKSNVTKLK